MNLNTVFRESDEVSNQSRQAKQKSKIIRTLSKSRNALTIPELQKQVRISPPTTIKLINELIEENLVREEGKKETENGRKPMLYSLNINRFYAVGVEIQFKRISVSLVRLDQKVIFEKQDQNFDLKNTSECLQDVITFIQDTIEESKVAKDNILGIGIGLTGRVNTITGESYNFFNFTEKPVGQYLSDIFQKRVIIDNDTHVMGLAEQVLGQAKDARNALVLNVSRGLGMTIIANQKLITGGMGFAGEFGHMQLENSDKLCICGKRGCLGMEVSGFALEENFKIAIQEGGTSLLLNDKSLDKIRYEDILTAANQGDGLSINLLQNMGEILGKTLGNIINLLNPEQIILGGKFAQAGHIFTDSIKTGINKTALPLPLKYVTIKNSLLGSESVCIGASAMIFKQHDLI